jgi:hypothetical protein
MPTPDWRLALGLVGMSVASGCAMVGSRSSPANESTVVVSVRNPSRAAVSVSLCAPMRCSPFREIHGRREAEFRFVPTRGTRAVVVARRGDRVVDQRPIDFLAGQRYRVVLDVP